MRVDDLLARLEGVKKSGPQRWLAFCPAHRGEGKRRTPSLSIAALSDGRILLHDFGGCDVMNVLDSLNLEVGDLFAERRTAHRERAPASRAATPSIGAQDAWIVVRESEGEVEAYIHDYGGNARVLEQLDLRVGERFLGRLDWHRRAPILRPHVHAASDAISVMAQEALVLIFAANDMAAGVILSPETRERMLSAALTIRGAARLV